MTLLSVQRLSIDAADGRRLVHDFAIEVARGEIVGLVGESGSGKTMTALSLLGLLPDGVSVADGEGSLEGKPFMRGGRVGERPDATMIFQNPTAALNPTMKIGAQLVRLLAFLDRRDRAGPGHEGTGHEGTGHEGTGHEDRGHEGTGRTDGHVDAGATVRHGRTGARERRRRAEALLESVGIREPRTVLGRYPHQLSGGMNQRVMIAMAVTARPSLLIADEPTTGLDVTVQAQILELIRSTVTSRGIGVLLVSHDMGVIAQTCHRVAVMRAGEIREFANVDDVFHAPADTYTEELIAAAADRAEDGDGTPAR
jgi:ABC-type dipeptide/oligopeptide/nickel transport system ATPase component